jgi:hypothetical protein
MQIFILMVYKIRTTEGRHRSHNNVSKEKKKKNLDRMKKKKNIWKS